MQLIGIRQVFSTKIITSLKQLVYFGMSYLISMVWITVKGKTFDLEKLYDEIYANGALRYEIETFSSHGECEIKYYR